MPALADGIAAVVESVFAELLDLRAQPTASPSAASGPVLRASVRISGAWQGMVVVDCPEELARRTAAAMWGGQPRDRAQMADAIGELANMIAGNVKVLLPGPSRLSLPAVADGQAASSAPPRGVVAGTTVACDGQPLTVWLRELDPDGS
jgi:CheY-specific phosphatase CheX